MTTYIKRIHEELSEKAKEALKKARKTPESKYIDLE